MALNNCLCHRKLFQNGVNTFSNMVTIFAKKSSKMCIFLTIRLCSSLNSMCFKYLSKWCMERLKTSNVSISNGNIKFRVGKSIFAVSLPLKLFLATVANTYIGSLKSLHTLFDTYLDHMLVIFEPNRFVRNVHNVIF